MCRTLRASGCRHPCLKCVSASGAPLGLPEWPACLDDSLTTLRLAGWNASCGGRVGAVCMVLLDLRECMQ